MTIRGGKQKNWTPRENSEFTRLWIAKVPSDDIAVHFGVSRRAVEHRRAFLKLNPRQRGFQIAWDGDRQFRSGRKSALSTSARLFRHESLISFPEPLQSKWVAELEKVRAERRHWSEAT